MAHFGMMGDWHSTFYLDIKTLEDRVCLGDRLEFARNRLYAHWGIYVGGYQGMRHAVIHFGIFEGGAAFSKKKTSGSAFAASQVPEVRADTIGEILGGSDRVRINNYRDHDKLPLSIQAISEKAKKMHREKTSINYNLFKSNCEHFVNRCRYGDSYSAQITATRNSLLRYGFLVALVVAIIVLLILDYVT